MKRLVNNMDNTVANFIPSKRPHFIKTKNFDYIVKVYERGRFRPILATGDTGTGKSLTAEQVCAHLGLPMVKMSVTQETSRHELIGHFALVDGNTQFKYGAVIEAMKMGAVLVLDEFDAGNTNKLLCLQEILNGNGYHISELNETVYPKEGFQVFLTANTKGLGDETGKFFGTGYMNEAFLERISIVLEFDYMTEEEELEAMKLYVEDQKHDLSAYDLGGEDTASDDNKSVLERIANFASEFRKQQKSGSSMFGSEHSMSTRRLHMLVDELEISDGSVVAAMQTVFSRFNDSFRDAAIDYYISLFGDDSKRGEDENVADAGLYEYWLEIAKKKNQA